MPEDFERRKTAPAQRRRARSGWRNPGGDGLLFWRHVDRIRREAASVSRRASRFSGPRSDGNSRIVPCAGEEGHVFLQRTYWRPDRAGAAQLLPRWLFAQCVFEEQVDGAADS